MLFKTSDLEKIIKTLECAQDKYKRLLFVLVDSTAITDILQHLYELREYRRKHVSIELDTYERLKGYTEGYNEGFKKAQYIYKVGAYDIYEFYFSHIPKTDKKE